MRKITDANRREFNQYKSSYYSLIRELRQLYADQAPKSIIQAKEEESEKLIQKLIVDTQDEARIRDEARKILFS